MDSERLSPGAVWPPLRSPGQTEQKDSCESTSDDASDQPPERCGVIDCISAPATEPEPDTKDESPIPAKTADRTSDLGVNRPHHRVKKRPNNPFKNGVDEAPDKIVHLFAPPVSQKGLCAPEQGEHRLVIIPLLSRVEAMRHQKGGVICPSAWAMSH